MNSNPHVDIMSTQNTEPSAPKPARAVVNPAGIPESMKARGQWVLWKYEWRVSRNGGKWTKPPYSLSGYSASTTKPNTWTTFQKAFAAYESSTEFDGIGYVFAEGDGLAGVDLDHCMAIDGNGKRGFAGPGAAIAREIFTRFKGKAYIEYSPSGDGLHIIVKGSLERSGKGKDGLNWIEAYDHTSPRYFTFTGDVSKSTGREPGDGQAELDWLYEAYLKRPEAVVVPIRPAPAATVADDEDILIRARLAGGSGPKFVAMFDEGLTADRENITDQSADDLALCNLLAFWTDRNPDQMDRLFRQSALMRDKWDAMRGGRTYGQMTITKAIDGCRQTIKDLDAERGAGSGSGARGSASGDGWLGGVVNSPVGIGGEVASDSPELAAEIERLARLSSVDYSRERKAAASRLGLSRVTDLDGAVNAGKRNLLSDDADDSDGRRPATLANVVRALRDMQKSGIEVAFDEFTSNQVWTPAGKSDWQQWTDSMSVEMRIRLAEGGLKEVAKETMKDALLQVGDANLIDTAILWANGLPDWDGKPRCASFFVDYFAAASNAYVRAVGLYTWSALAGRLLTPGVKADMVPTLVGAQGARKSSAVEAMAPSPETFAELSLHEKDDDLKRSLVGVLIGELGELAGLRKREVEELKAFIVRKSERWVPKFHERARTYMRRVLFIATTNEENFLRDPTGERRWLPIRVGQVDVDGILANRDQLWAEAITLYKANGVMFRQAEELAKDVVLQHKEESPDLELIQEWLESRDKWAAFGADDSDGFKVSDRPYIKTTDIAIQALHLDARDAERNKHRISSAMKALGYSNVQRRFETGQKFRAWVKVC